MKSRTSFFDTAVLKKNITRFAPVWALYLVGLLMIMGIMAQDAGIWYASDMAESLLFMPALSFGYALVVAQLLFGDLYNSRMCNALHALPLRREGWFLTNVASGLLFSLVPNAVMAVLSMVLSGKLWLLPWAWLLCATVQYLFFFGVAVLCAYLVGNRFAMALVYLILNLFSLIAYWLVESLYVPNLYGIVLEDQIFFTLSPVVEMCSFSYLDVVITNANGIRDGYWYFFDGWGYIGICAAIGIGAMVLALALYRKRHLECAGDFIAVKGLGPVFLVLYTLCAGACCHGFFDLFLGNDSDVYLLIGLVIGFFTGLMLLERQVRVFRKKTFLGFAALVLVFFGTILGAQTDVLGIVRWVPKAQQVESVSISTGSSFYYYSPGGFVQASTADIETAIFLHQAGLENRDWNTNGKPDTRLELTYTMKNGLRRSREYAIDVASEAGRLLEQYLSRPETVLQELHGFGAIDQAEFYDPGTVIADRASLAKLYDAIVADCEAGKMAQDWNFHADGNSYYISLRYTEPDGIHYYREIMVWEDCQNIMAWVEEMGIEFEKWE